MTLPPFAALAATTAPSLEHLALAFARELRGEDEVDVGSALLALDTLGTELRDTLAVSDEGPLGEATALAAVLGGAHGFRGEQAAYEDPDASMLDLVLGTRRGLPILLSAVYEETARRAGLPVWGIGLPGHFVVGHFGADPPLVLDPFNGGAIMPAALAGGRGGLRRWTPQEIALRMLTNLVGVYTRRHDLARAIRAARLRMALPAGPAHRATLSAELIALEARLN